MPDARIDVAKKDLQELLEKFKRDSESGRIKSLKEEDTKKDYITPLFRALGWDVENKITPDEVTNEDQISKGRVDYAFRLNGIPKFFLEAKALKIGLDEPKDAAQAINYAWHKGTSWAVLTDFETLIVYNAEVKGKTIADSQFIRLTCDQFVAQFSKLWWLSKPAFHEGLLDQEALAWGKKLRRTKVGDQLLSELMCYRQLLTKSINKNNTTRNLTEDELDEAVQKIIDRLIFIRTTEDRSIEPKHLISIVREFETGKRGKVTTALNQIYLQYDERYDSKLFTFDSNDLSKRHLCETLEIDNEVLLEVINGLYRSKDGLIEYDFSAIDADVLGNIYEQYLSHILRKTEKRAKLESKEAHRKEQGIYYTPTYIVEYIIRNTLGEVLKRKKSEEVNQIKVLDMACGSGSFLLKAFDVIDAHHQKHDKDYAQTKLDVEHESARITKKIKILKNNIYGVDLDPKAVEIAQLNLLLKAAETRHRLPDLRENIKCGNSLISDPAFAGERAFDWGKEFAGIMNEGGFDIIVGNPPYGSTFSQSEKQYMKDKFEVAEIKVNNFALFVERAIKLLKPGGKFGMIFPNSLLTYKEYSKLRGFLSKNCKILQIINYGGGVFGDATISTMTLVLEKTIPSSVNNITVIEYPNDFHEGTEGTLKYMIKQSLLSEEKFNLVDETTSLIVTKISKNKPLLGSFSDIFGGGIQTGDDEKFLSDKKLDSTYRQTIKGRDIHRYSLTPSKWVLYDKTKLYGAGNEDVFNASEKIVLMRCTYGLPYRLMAAIDRERCCTLKGNVTVIVLKKEAPSYEFILALLNSKLLNYFYKKTVKNRAVTADDLTTLPIITNIPDKTTVIESYSKKMLILNERLHTLKDKQTDESAKLEKEIAETDAKIDQLVYDLYGLTAQERKIVEEAVK